MCVWFKNSHSNFSRYKFCSSGIFLTAYISSEIIKRHIMSRKGERERDNEMHSMPSSDRIYVVYNVFQGLASGTLLYVVFFEILHKHREGLFQYLSIILGFSVMFGLQMLSKCTTNIY